MKFEQLDVWKRSSRLACDIYKALANCKDYGFKDQVTRSAISIPSNIAEGMERDSQADQARFLYYSKGSAGELVTQIYIGIEIGLIERELGLKLIAESKEVASMLAALIKIRKSSIKETEPNYTLDEPRT
ncbi:four helix bundle protein [Pseudoalteromonas sp. D48-MNA-CIBAN-0056]|uniref:four helix bundle protein n=1 Tax=Pseudoalteromonas sp. D48-MNA-CIBAN-0056 TaxID=3140417 RepID=UPI00331C5B41